MFTIEVKRVSMQTFSYYRKTKSTAEANENVINFAGVWS